jgi:hypothetical protein
VIDPAPTRGERNNNPGNLRELPGDHWEGERATDDDPEFEEFDAPEDGIRALAKTLLTYQRKHGLATLRQIITRWAPPSENDTEAYIEAVAGALTVSADQPIDLTDRNLLVDLVKAIICRENGRCIYSDATILSGVNRALA